MRGPEAALHAVARDAQLHHHARLPHRGRQGEGGLQPCLAWRGAVCCHQGTAQGWSWLAWALRELAEKVLCSAAPWPLLCVSLDAPSPPCFPAG